MEGKMRKPIYSYPDAFSMSPFMVLLPVRGSVVKLPSLSTSLFARYEKVKSQIQEAESHQDNALLPRFRAEEAMLKHVLDWVATHKEAGK